MKVPLLLPGTTFGKWTVKEFEKRETRGHPKYNCVCSCGKKDVVDHYHLLGGFSKGCRSCSGKDSSGVCKKGHPLDVHGRDTRGQCKLCRIAAHLRYAYGISLEDYVALWSYQAGKCAVCKKPIALSEAFQIAYEQAATRAEVDHRHVPKKVKPQPEKRTLVRGLLCGGRYAGCNAKLGHVDKIEWLKAAVSYLEELPAQRLFSVLDESRRKFESEANE